jgi:hypothetical protein
MILEIFFFPALVGMLIGSEYKKSVKYFVYTTFSIYTLLNLSCGDRGSWLYKLIVLVWLSYKNNKSINVKKLLFFSSVGLGFLYIVYAIVDLRNKQITLSNIMITTQKANNNLQFTYYIEH